MDQEWEWRQLQDFHPGDFIHRWGDWLEVVEVNPPRVHNSKAMMLLYRDGTRIGALTGQPDSEYIAKKRTS